MNTKGRIALIGIVVVAVTLIIIGKTIEKHATGQQAEQPNQPKAEAQQVEQQAMPAAKLPKLVDLGRGTCGPCKAMKPILTKLTNDYKGQLEVVYIDLNNDSSAAEKYGIRMIPTQIFYDAAGKEIFRHEGFMGKDDILKKCTELGFKLTVPKESK